MFNIKSIIILTISILLNTSLSAEDRMCFGQVPQDSSNKLIAKISISQGNKIFQERKCSHYFKYFDGHVSDSQNQCNVDTAGLTLDRGYAPLGVFFRGWESTPKADIKKYYWEIKSVDGTLLATYEAFNAAYIFEEPGQYIATLTVTSTTGAQSVARHTVDVWERKGNNYYVDSKIGDDRYNGLTKLPKSSCDVAKSSVGSCNGPWKTATRAFGEMNPYDVKVMPDGKYTADAICLDSKVEEIRQYKQGNFKLFRSSTNVESEALKDSDGNSLATIQVDVCTNTASKRKTVLSPGDQVLFKRNQIFEVETARNVMSSYEAERDGIKYQYERLDTQALTIVGHWSPAMGVNFSAYGSGDNPLIKNVGKSSNALINLQGIGMMHFSFVDLNFDLASAIPNALDSNRANFIESYQSPTNLVFKRVDVKNMNQGIIASTVDGDGLFVFDSKFFDSNVTQFFSEHSHENVAIVGNNYDYSANHLIYSSIDSGLIYDNKLTRPAFGRTAYRLANGSFTKPNRFVWISNNEISGWIDPRTYENDGRAFSNGKRYNNNLIDISSNRSDLSKAVHDVVFTHNIVRDGEVMLRIGSAENISVTENNFITADNSFASRVDLNALKSRRPLKNITISNNNFIEKSDVTTHGGGVSATIALRNYYQQECTDQKNNENITITGNRFEFPGTHRKPFRFSPLKQLGTLPDLTLDQSEVVLRNTIQFSDNDIRATSIDIPLFQIGGEYTAAIPPSGYEGWEAYYEGRSELKDGGTYRLYNHKSNFIQNLMFGTELKLLAPVSNIQQDSHTVNESTESQQEMVSDSTAEVSESSLISAAEEVSTYSQNEVSDYIIVESNENDLLVAKQEQQVDSYVDDEFGNVASNTIKNITSKLVTATLSPEKIKTKQKYNNTVTLGHYKSSQGISSVSSSGIKNRKPCRAEASDGRCLLQ